MWDWRWPLTDLRNEIREARVAGETVTQLHKLEHALDLIAAKYERLEAEDRAEQQRSLTSAVADMHEGGRSNL